MDSPRAAPADTASGVTEILNGPGGQGLACRHVSGSTPGGIQMGQIGESRQANAGGPNANTVDGDEGWAELGRVYREDEIVPALGAGVSMRSGIPNWEELMARLAGPVPGGEELFAHLRGQGLSLQVIASIIEGRSPSREAFIQAVREALYRDFPFFP